MDYLIFLVAAAAVVFSGIKLSQYGDIVAEISGLGHSFVGIVLISFFTSLPELISTIGAITVVDSPNLAFGNVYGSNIFNMFVIFVLDAVFRKTDLYIRVSRSNVVAGLYAVIIMLITILALTMDFPVILWINVISLVIFGTFLYSNYITYRSSDGSEEHESSGENYDHVERKSVFGLFFFFAFVIVVSGLVMSKSADSIAVSSGLGQSFVGSFMLAVVTSLPEMAACFAALRIGAVNMAFGNLMGSNVFNMVILPFADLLYVKGDIYRHAEHVHIVSAFTACIVTVIAIAGIVEIKTRFKFKGIAVHSYAILGMYGIYTVYMYLAR